MWPIWVCNIAGKLSWKTCHRQAFRCTVCLSSHLLRSNPAFTRRSQQWERMWTEDSNFFFGFDHNWIQLWTTFQLNRMWLKGYTNCLDDGVLNKNTNHRVRLEYNTRNNWYFHEVLHIPINTVWMLLAFLKTQYPVKNIYLSLSIIKLDPFTLVKNKTTELQSD